MRDCVVIETYLDVATKLRAAGLESPIVSVSSNKQDYAKENGFALKADLAVEFVGLGMEYAPGFAAAKAFLGLLK